MVRYISKKVSEEIELRKETFGAEKEAFQEFCRQNSKKSFVNNGGVGVIAFVVVAYGRLLRGNIPNNIDKTA